MATHPSLSVTGDAPFSQDGVFEVEVAITEAAPSITQIQEKSFSSIWTEKTQKNTSHECCFILGQL